MNSKYLLAGSVFGFQVLAAEARREFVAPPVPPGIEVREAVVPQGGLKAAATVYSIGEPTAEEQLYIELINRSRANPIAEAEFFATTTDPEVAASLDFFNVDLVVMRAQFATNPPVPPLAPNAELMAAARRHTGDMLTNSFQEHIGSDNSNPPQRMTAAGYNWNAVGENVYANAETVLQGHAGFDVDWGDPRVQPTIGGMQSPPGHRNAIHNAGFREVGVGVLFGNNTPAPGSTIPGSRPVGPQLVTQEFGSRPGLTPFVTGVVYFDLNGNSFYDVGEGIGGVQVAANGTATTAITAKSGGYALPVSANATYTVTFSGQGLAETRQVTVTNQNVKVDLRPAYAAPAITGSAEPVLNAANPYQIAPVPAASAYQWRSVEMLTPQVEGAENGDANVTIEQVGNYDVVQSATRKSGSSAFQLAHPVVQEQRLTLNGEYVLNANSELRFASRLGWATANQRAVAQISTNNGATWQDIYSQAGTTSAGERSFQDRSVHLGHLAGATAKFRFRYVPTGSSYIDVDDETGWFIDDILVAGALEIGNEQIAEATDRAFTFQPASIKDYVLQARALTGHEFLPWGPQLSVRPREGTVTPPTLRFTGLSAVNAQLTFDLELLTGSIPATLRLETKAMLDAPWSDAPITGTETLSATRLRVTAGRGGGSTAFYRIRAE